jgi:hypothetical protein
METAKNASKPKAKYKCVEFLRIDYTLELRKASDFSFNNSDRFEILTAWDAAT